MDYFIRRFDAVEDRDLMLCRGRGVAWQKDMTFRRPDGVNSDGVNYFDHYAAFEGSPVGAAIHAGRVDLVNTYAGAECPVLDVGIGSGEFIRSRPNTFGRDVNPKAVEWLRSLGLLGAGLDTYKAFTFWDVIEHIEDPNRYFKRIPDGAFLFTSLPIFAALDDIRGSKHYKPGEHLYYWTEQGFVDWMAMYRFRLLTVRDFESAAGRDSIKSFAFVKDMPGYHVTLDQYRIMHAQAYGTSAHDVYFDLIAREVLQRNPRSILDFGCGRGNVAAYFWKDGERVIANYDPAISQFKTMPDGHFDLVLCNDVMEHILIGDIEQVFRDIRSKSKSVLFTISLRPARAKLPDGRNAHVTLLTAAEWLRWIREAFGAATRIDTGKEHLLMVRTF